MLRYVLIFAAYGLPPLLEAADYCPLPVLKRSQAVHVSVPDIDKPGCGVVLLDGRIVMLSAAADVTDTDPVCSSNGRCTKMKTFRLPPDPERYVLVFEGPRVAPPAN